MLAEVLEMHLTICVCFGVISNQGLVCVSLRKDLLIVVEIAGLLPHHGDTNPQLYWHTLALLRVGMALYYLRLL